MFKKILIANRGEIALRVIQACRELGIPTVAVYSTADRDSLHVTYADEEVCIGPPQSASSYLNISSIVSAAEITGADGRGMRIVHAEKDLESQFSTAREEATKAFGDGSIYLKKYLVEPRHIVFQVFGDRHGTVVHLGERECSIQRRHQKLIEEAPSVALTPALRAKMGEAAVNLCKRVGYENAGTIEFLLDSDGSYYFMEMNTRIQVEHPVTEMVYGVDLVKEQILVAAGNKLTFAANLKPRGHAIECRVNAENPETFAP